MVLVNIVWFLTINRLHHDTTVHGLNKYYKYILQVNPSESEKFLGDEEMRRLRRVVHSASRITKQIP